jgi:TonB family protein
MKIRTAAPLVLMTALIAACATKPTAQDPIPSHQEARAIFSSCDKPVYPAAAVTNKREGTVTLGFEVSADGKPVASKVQKSSGHSDLDEAARASLMLCTFYPATRDGKPVQEWMHIQYVWSLK